MRRILFIALIALLFTSCAGFNLFGGGDSSAVPSYTTPVPYNTMAIKLGSSHIIIHEIAGQLAGKMYKDGEITERDSIKAEMTLDEYRHSMKQLTQYSGRSAAGEPVDEFVKSALDNTEFRMWELLKSVGITKEQLFPEGGV